MNKESSIKLTGCQIKSLDIARELSTSLSIIEATCGIRVVRIILEDSFICPDINTNDLRRAGTPMDIVLAEVIDDYRKSEKEINSL